MNTPKGNACQKLVLDLEKQNQELIEALKEAMEWDWLTCPEEIPKAIHKKLLSLIGE